MPHEQTVGLAHAGCEADALAVMEKLHSEFGCEDFMIVCYEAGTGSHVGPDALALFFRGQTQRS